jgi:hypothetical protein
VTGLSKNATQPREQHSMQPDGPSVTVSLKWTKVFLLE